MPVQHDMFFGGPCIPTCRGVAGPVKDLGHAVPAQEKKNRWPSIAHKPVDYSCRAVPCRAVLVGRANGPWAMIVGSYFFKKY